MTELDAARKSQISAPIRCLAERQIDAAGVGARLEYAPEEFQVILEEHPDLKRELEIARHKGLGNLRQALWEKAVEQKNWDALKFLAEAYLGMGAKVSQDKGYSSPSVNLSDEQLKAIYDIYYPQKG